MKILHITDFHIDSPDSSNENLRKGFYNEFVDNLFTLINNKNLGKIDVIVNTGDFVNVGKTENYAHAKDIMDYVLVKSNLTNEDVAVSVGNHDYKLKEDGTRAEKLIPFNSFSSNFHAGVLIGETDRCKLYEKPDQNVQILIIDNVTREDKVNEPCILETQEIDKIVRIVRDNASKAKNLIVVSHYPMMIFPLSKYVSEEMNWTRDHIWTNGFNMQHRLSSLRPNGETIFLCGDGHIPDAYRTGNKTFVMTGLFGGDYTKKSVSGTNGIKSYHIQTQARIIDFGGGSQPIVHTFNYKPLGFAYDPNAGTWEYESSFLREVVDKPKSQVEPSQSRTTVLTEPLQAEIINRIKKEKLFKIGRFITSADHHSLAWISINRLFEEQQIIVNLIDKGIVWLDSIIKNKDRSVIIGVDFWGAMLATHFAVRLGQKIECFSSKVLDNDSGKSPLDSLITNIAGIAELKDIVIVTDVVASGHSVLKLITEIEIGFTSLKGIPPDFNYHSISVISDSEIVREEFDRKITSIKTACASLRMPIVRSEQLPNTDIFSSTIDFTN